MTIFNLRAIAKQMKGKNKPKGTDIYKFMEGASVFTKEQITSMEVIVDNEHRALKQFLHEQKKRIS